MARRRRYNPSQKRDYHGRWAAGSLSGTKASGAAGISRGTGSVARSATGNTKRYDAYLAKQAQQKQAARKTAIKRVALGAALVGAAGAGAYIGSRGNKSTKDAPLGNVAHVPVKSQAPKTPVIGKATTPKKMETSGFGPRHVSPAPVESKHVNGTPVSLVRTTPKKKANPTANPVKTPTTTGVSTVKEEHKIQHAPAAPKPKPNPTSNPVPTPGVVKNSEGAAPIRVRGLNDKERIALENRRIQAARKLAQLEKKSGVNAGSQARKDFEKKQVQKRTKKQAALERQDKKRTERRDDMSKYIQQSFSATAVVKTTGSRRDRAEARYATILENMMDSGGALNRKQRQFLKDYGV